MQQSVSLVKGVHDVPQDRWYCNFFSLCSCARSSTRYVAIQTDIIGGSHQIMQRYKAPENWSEDDLKHTTSGSGQAFASYTVVSYAADPATQTEPHFYGFGLGPWLYADGNLSLPINHKAPALSAFQSGIELQTEIKSIIPDTRTSLELGVAPYFQTDFVGIGRIEGVDFQLQPTNYVWHLNSRDDASQPRLVTYVIGLFGDANLFHVQDAGYTNFRSNTDYDWLGGTTELRLTFFQATGPEFLQNRLYAIGTAQFHEDVYSKLIAREYQGEVGYKLGGGDAGSSAKGSSQSGQATISLIYTNGVDVATLQRVEQVKLAFSFKY